MDLATLLPQSEKCRVIVFVGKVGTQPTNLFELKTALRNSGAALNGHSQAKIFTRETALVQVEAWKANGDKVVFTNGCFDLLHGKRLVVGLNSAGSVRRLERPTRPILSEQDRACILGSIDSVDMVVLFEEDHPEKPDRRLEARRPGQGGRLPVGIRW